MSQRTATRKAIKARQQERKHEMQERDQRLENWHRAVAEMSDEDRGRWLHHIVGSAASKLDGDLDAKAAQVHEVASTIADLLRQRFEKSGDMAVVLVPALFHCLCIMGAGYSAAVCDAPPQPESNPESSPESEEHAKWEKWATETSERVMNMEQEERDAWLAHVIGSVGDELMDAVGEDKIDRLVHSAADELAPHVCKPDDRTRQLVAILAVRESLLRLAALYTTDLQTQALPEPATIQ